MAVIRLTDGRGLAKSSWGCYHDLALELVLSHALEKYRPVSFPLLLADDVGKARHREVLVKISLADAPTHVELVYLLQKTLKPHKKIHPFDRGRRELGRVGAKKDVAARGHNLSSPLFLTRALSVQGRCTLEHATEVGSFEAPAVGAAEGICQIPIEAHHSAVRVYIRETQMLIAWHQITERPQRMPPKVFASTSTHKWSSSHSHPHHHKHKHAESHGKGHEHPNRKEAAKTGGVRKWIRNRRRGAKKHSELHLARIKKRRARIDDINQNGDLGPVVRFVKSNVERVKIITEGIFDIPFDLAYHLLGSLHALVILGGIGFLWILVWMLTETFSIEFQGKVGEAYTIVNVAIDMLNILIDSYVFMVLGPIVEFIQVIACDLKLGPISIKQHLPKAVKSVFCDALPGAGNPHVIPNLVPKSRFISVFWSHLENMQSDCADFSTGIEEFQATFKLLLSPYVCPVLQHVRPVAWLHDAFYYTIGWASWAEGTKGSYENELARAITHHDRTAGLKGNPSCKPPPDALWCYMFGLGFLIIEIILPLFVVMLVFTPIKRIVKAALAIVMSLLYHLFDFITNLIEKLLGSINWAGPRRAWLVVILLCTLTTTLVAWDLMGVAGIALGAAMGVAISVYTIETRGGHFFKGPSPTEVYTASGFIAAAIMIPCLSVTVFKGDSIEIVKDDYVY